MRSDTAWSAAVVALALTLPAPIWAQGSGPRPLSAIDWLGQEAPGTARTPERRAISEPPVAGAVSIPAIEMTPLGAATSGAVGLLPTAVTGLPASLWAASDARDLDALWARARQQPSPAIGALYHTLLLAEADPPRGGEDAFLGTRVAMLRRFGAVDPALGLLARAGPNVPALFTLWFDLSLLDGAEAEACTALRDAPGLMRDDGAKIYCSALTGDWRTAALLFDTGVALGTITGSNAALLAQFLDAELAEEAIVPPPSAAPTPLEFRLFEAIGMPLSTRGLPLAFAMADLRGTAGWRAEIEAAERLTRAGALAPGRLMGLYTRQRPAASGGIWDRADAVQTLDAALDARDPVRSAAALEAAWAQMRGEGLEVPFADIFGTRLAQIELPANGQALATQIRLLSPEYEAAADAVGSNAFIAGLAHGRPDAKLASNITERAIADAFANPPASAPEHAALIAEGKLGEAILSAALQFDRADDDPGEMASALGTLRAVGLEDTARRAALQALILADGG